MAEAGAKLASSLTDAELQQLRDASGCRASVVLLKQVVPLKQYLCVCTASEAELEMVQSAEAGAAVLKQRPAQKRAWLHAPEAAARRREAKRKRGETDGASGSDGEADAGEYPFLSVLFHFFSL